MPGRLLYKIRQEVNAARTTRELKRIPTIAAPTIPATMTSRLSQYNTILNLSKNDDRKLYLEALKGLKESNLFTGKKTDFDQFSKLMGKSFEDVRVIKSLIIPTEWDTTNADAAL